jgi:hypothetical protein
MGPIRIGEELISEDREDFHDYKDYLMISWAASGK